MKKKRVIIVAILALYVASWAIWLKDTQYDYVGAQKYRVEAQPEQIFYKIRDLIPKHKDLYDSIQTCYMDINDTLSNSYLIKFQPKGDYTEIGLVGCNKEGLCGCNIVSDCSVTEAIKWGNTFERNILNPLGFSYQKAYGQGFVSWYCRWFFRNQLYIIGLFYNTPHF